MKYDAVIAVPASKTKFNIGIKCNTDALTRIDFLGPSTQLISPKTMLANAVVDQLFEYFSNPGFCFDVPVQLQGTDYQQRVWRALQDIPVARTLSYGQLADQLHSSARAIGNACRNNPIPLIVPCHRVVAKNSIGGFGGETQGRRIAIKKWLLQHETNSLLNHAH